MKKSILSIVDEIEGGLGGLSGQYTKMQRNPSVAIAKSLKGKNIKITIGF